MNNGTSREYIFTENGSFTFKFKDKAGNEGSVTANVTCINKEQEKPVDPVNPEKPDEYKLGDINKDEKITATDLLLLKRHLVAGQKQEWILKDNAFKAGDMNKDGKITATDLILLKRLVLQEMKQQ